MLETIPLWLIWAALFVLMMVASVVGAALQKMQKTRHDPSQDDGRFDNYVVSAIYGLLALLMAFGFSLAIERYEHRRQLVIDEANAIGTMADRLALAPTESRATLLDALRSYVDERSSWGRSADQEEGRVIAERADAAAARFGRELGQAIANQPYDARTILLVQANNAMNDLATARHALREAHLPRAVIALLVAMCVTGGLVLGFSIGTYRRNSAALGLLFALLSLAFVTILDLDRPRGGAIVIPQEELDLVAAKIHRLS